MPQPCSLDPCPHMDLATLHISQSAKADQYGSHQTQSTVVKYDLTSINRRCMTTYPLTVLTTMLNPHLLYPHFHPQTSHTIRIRKMTIN
jgi:hypothetical protein